MGKDASENPRIVRESDVSYQGEEARIERPWLVKVIRDQFAIEQVRDVTYETLKAKLREVLEKPQELSKENGKVDTELRDFAA